MLRTALLTLDSTKINAAALADIETILYGSAFSKPRLPLPDEILQIIGSYEHPQPDLTEDLDDAGTYMISTKAITEDPADPGTYLVNKARVSEDPADPGTYLIGE